MSAIPIITPCTPNPLSMRLTGFDACEDTVLMPHRAECPLCSSTAQVVGHKLGPVTKRDYEIRICDQCGFGFVANPNDRFAEVYDDNYYAGRGADPLVDYLAEIESPQTTIRVHEWQGMDALAGTLVPPGQNARWLDYGCGNGLLVRHVNRTKRYDCFGYDISAITTRAREAGTPILTDDELTKAEGSFDLVTALEVIEHIADPIAELRRIWRLLKPGGIFLYTTGNASRHRRRLTVWDYVNPDIHVSYFSPENAALALRAAGFQPEPLGYRAGSGQIIRFKTLKNLGARRISRWHDLVPWTLLSPLLNRRFGVFDFPYGRRPK